MHFSIHHFPLFLNSSVTTHPLTFSPAFAASTLTFSPFSPLEGVTIATTEEEAKNESKESSEPMDIDGKSEGEYVM